MILVGESTGGSVLLFAGEESAGFGAGTEGTEEGATAAAAAAAYRMGGKGAAFGAGASVFAGFFSTTGDGATLISMVLLREGCLFAATGLGGCSSVVSFVALLTGVAFFSFSSFAGVLGGAATGGSGFVSAMLEESRLDNSS